MKKIISLILAAVLVVGLFTTIAYASESDLPSYKFNLATAFYDPEGSPNFNADGRAAQKFADLVNERSNGRVTIAIHWAGVLGSNNEALEQVRSGDIDMNLSNVFTSLDTRFGVFNLPNLIDDFDMAAELVVNREGPLYKVMEGILADNNIKLLSTSVGQFRGIFNNKKEIHVPEDCEGLMMRAYSDEIVTTFWGGLCNTTILPASDIYTGMQLGTVDGFEFAPTAMIANGYTEVVKNYSDINWQWQTPVNFMMNQTLFDSLDEETQNLLLDCAMEASGVYYRELIEEYVDEAIQYMKDNGIQVYNLTDEERQAWIDYGTSKLPELKEIAGEDVFDAVVSAVEEYRANK